MALIQKPSKHLVKNSYTFKEDLLIIKMSNEGSLVSEIVAALAKKKIERSVFSVRYRLNWLSDKKRASWTKKDLAVYHGVQKKVTKRKKSSRKK